VTTTEDRHAPSDDNRSFDELQILDAGLLSTVQDLGRTGYAHLGVTSSGAADRASLTLANRLVGNAEGAAAVENTCGGLTVALTTSRHVAVTGAQVAVTVDSVVVAEPSRFYAHAGQRIHLGRPVYGLHTYLSVAGGLDVARVLGSASRDTLSGLGSAPLQPDQALRLGQACTATLPDVPLELIPQRVPPGHADIAFRWGPRDALFSRTDRAQFAHTDWMVSPQTDRVGARLIGPALSIGEVHLSSEGMMRGAIQVPPSGAPIVFLADHPVTGGYPVIGVVADDDIALIAQATPGTILRFTAQP
jgi:biotin-dependent carboxylase-like uncharacterized protein